MCAVAGGLLHYFLLVTFLLMAAEAISLYTKLVIVMGIPDIIRSRYVLKATLISWSEFGSNNHGQRFTWFHSLVVPLFIVIISEAPDWKNYVEDEK